MAKAADTLPEKWQSFFANLSGSVLNRPRFWVNLIGWVFFLWATILSLTLGFKQLLPLVLLLLYFSHHLFNEVEEELQPPGELLLILTFCFMLPEQWSLSRILAARQLGASLPLMFKIGQIILVSLISLTFGLLLTKDSHRKSGTLILLFFIALFIDRFGGSRNLYWYLLEFLTILLYLRKTNWTEKFSRKECWVYFLFSILAYVIVEKLSLMIPAGMAATETDVYTRVSLVLMELFRFYLIALFIRIPLVLVYHHARLARKIRIATLFQSNFPLIIQFILLLLIFYFFISGWQAETFLQTLAGGVENSSLNGTAPSPGALSFPVDSTGTPIHIPGYRPVSLPEQLPGSGMLELHPVSDSLKARHIFLFKQRKDSLGRRLMLFPVDSLLLGQAFQHLSLMMANRIVGYSFRLTHWDSLLYRWPSWQTNSFLTSFRIFPFAFHPPDRKNIHVAYSPHRYGDIHGPRNLFFQFMDKIGLQLTVGRTYSRLYDDRFRQQGYWAFDLIFSPGASFGRSPLLPHLFFWLFVYLLVNFLVIEQVVHFGNKITRMIVQKFEILKYGIRQISEGNLNYRIRMEGEDEFVELGRRFNRMGDQLKKTIEEVRVKERFENELKIAREVQLHLLPATLPEIPGYQVAASLKTAREVGGDFYDVSPLSQNRFAFAIGDVSGKSTSAAFYMAQSLSLVRFAYQFSANPVAILNHINDYFSQSSIDPQIFVTMILAVLDKASHQVQIARAGHNRPFFIPADPGEGIRELPSPGLGIGLARQGQIFRDNLKPINLRLAPGDTLIFYTDGIVEAARPASQVTSADTKKEFFGEKRLITLLMMNRTKNAQELLRLIVDEIEAFYGDHPLVDDYSLLILQRKKREG